MVKRKAKGLGQLEAQIMAMPRGSPQGVIKSQIDLLSQIEKHALLAELEKKVHRGVDMNYIRTVLFPEFYNFDIPQPLSNLSYARFTDKQEFVINTGGPAAAGHNGAGVLLWFPKVTTGPSLFWYRSTTENPSAGFTSPIPFSDVGGNKVLSKDWKVDAVRTYTPYFTQTALVAGAISIQYIGQIDAESGEMCGGHIYGQGIDKLVSDDIEHSQFTARGRPSEGLRFCYLPMEQTDYDYYNTTTDNSHSAGAQPTGDEKKFFVNCSDTTLKFDGATKLLPLPGKMDANIMYANGTHFVAIYWKGLPNNSTWLRVDVVRKFNGVPQTEFRDIMEVSRSSKNFDSKKTVDVLRNLCLNAPVGGHTLKDLDKTQDRIQSALPNLVADGMFDRIDSLQSLAEVAGVLETSTAQETGLVGDYSGISRRYPIDI